MPAQTRYDKPVVVQFAANSAEEFGNAAELVAGKVAGVGLNCGCPQRWAIQEGVGCALLKKPELVRDMVQTAKTRSGLHVEIKIRIMPDLKETIRMVRLAESVGVSWVTLHGRLPTSKPSDPVDYDAIKLIKEHASVPLVANGSVNSLQDVESIHGHTGCDGAMAARGLLVNPAMFAGYAHTPPECVGDYVCAALHYGSRFEVFSKTLEWMLCEVLNKTDRIQVKRTSTVDKTRCRDRLLGRHLCRPHADDPLYGRNGQPYRAVYRAVYRAARRTRSLVSALSADCNRLTRQVGVC